MENVKIKKILKVSLILVIFSVVSFILNTKTYAAQTYLSVKYNNTEVKRNTSLNLSLKYINQPIKWYISAHTQWKVYSKDNSVISIGINRDKGYITIKPLSATAQNGKATIKIYTTDNKISYIYYIQVTPIPILNVKYNNTEVEKNKYLSLSMKYANQPIRWYISAHTQWKVYSGDNKVINISIHRENSNYGYIEIKPISHIVNKGKASINIYTSDNKISYNYYIQVTPISTLSVKYNGKEQIQNKTLSLDMKYNSNPVIWNISAYPDWKASVNYTGVVSLSQDKDAGILKLKPVSQYVNGGNVNIKISTTDGKIVNNYIIKVTATAASSLNLPKSTLNLKSLETGKWEVGDSYAWKAKSTNENILKIWKEGRYLNYEARNTGKAYIEIQQNEFTIYAREVVVSKPKTDLKINRFTDELVQPLIEGFEAKWKVSSKYGWKVYSKDLGIIKVTDLGRTDGLLKFVAQNASKTDERGVPGFATITITENYTEESITYGVQVKPAVTDMVRESISSSVKVGDKVTLKVKTLPQNYVGLKNHGILTWKSLDESRAKVDQNGNVEFLKDGTGVGIVVTYSDNHPDHKPVSKQFTFNIMKAATTKISNLPETKVNPRTQNVTNISNGVPVYQNTNEISINGYKWQGKKYSLTNNQLMELAYLAYLEQGTTVGATMELSLMANLAEREGYSNVYNYVSNNGRDADSWFGPVNTGEYKNVHRKVEDIRDSETDEADEWRDHLYGWINGGLRFQYVKIAEEVLVDGIRYLPNYVDEHDDVGDIESISTGSVNDRKAYKPYETIVSNKYHDEGEEPGKWLFVVFAPGGDAFGTTQIDKYKGTKATGSTISGAKPTDLVISGVPHGVVYVGSTYTLKAHTIPIDYVGTAGTKVKWSSKNTNIAQIDNNGRVYLTGVGVTQITAEYTYGDISFLKTIDIKSYSKNGTIPMSSNSTNTSNSIGQNVTFETLRKKIYEKAVEYHKYMDEIGYEYPDENTGIYSDTFEQSKNERMTVCSTYVGWVLKDLNLLDEKLELINCQQLEEALLSTNKSGIKWEKIPGDKVTLQQGDIIIYGYAPESNGEQHRNHTDIYAGGGKKLSAGHSLGPDTNYGLYDEFVSKNINYDENGMIDLDDGWDRYWVYRPVEYK